MYDRAGVDFYFGSMAFTSSELRGIQWMSVVTPIVLRPALLVLTVFAMVHGLRLVIQVSLALARNLHVSDVELKREFAVFVAEEVVLRDMALRVWLGGHDSANPSHIKKHITEIQGAEAELEANTKRTSHLVEMGKTRESFRQPLFPVLPLPSEQIVGSQEPDLMGMIEHAERADRMQHSEHGFDYGTMGRETSAKMEDPSGKRPPKTTQV